MTARSSDTVVFFNTIANEVLPILQHYRRTLQSLEVSVKEDQTLLTQADVEVQKTIIDLIQSRDPHASIIAEETNLCAYDPKNPITWVIDPIDGTAQFVDRSNREFCVAVCQLYEGIPSNAMILLPEIGTAATPVLVVGLLPAKMVLVNGNTIEIPLPSTSLRNVSVTRSKGVPPHPFEERLLSLGCSMKIRTTSQSIDMLRTAINMLPYTDLPLDSFDVFYRNKQKIWDGAVGMCLNLIVGKKLFAADGKPLLPLTKAFLKQDSPTLPTTIAASDAVVQSYPEFFIQR